MSVFLGILVIVGALAALGFIFGFSVAEGDVATGLYTAGLFVAVPAIATGAVAAILYGIHLISGQPIV